MPSYDYSTLWEAFAGGEQWGDEYGEISPTTTDWEQRTKQFYGEVVGPAFGRAEGFGQDFSDFIASFDVADLSRAEEEFRMSIGDPYGGTEAGDPFAWQRLSRFSPEEAQRMLKGELYKYGEELGGETGAEYGIGMEKEAETYTSGLEAQREGLTYSRLEGSQGLASGTSGAVLRSGEGVEQAEDILSEAYKEARTLGTGFREGKEGIELDLRDNLDTALTRYLDTIDEEKEQWYNRILGDVARKTEITASEAGAEFESLEAKEDWAIGLTYGEEGEYEFRESGACGIGEVWGPDPDTGVPGCYTPEYLDLQYDEYGYYCPTSQLVKCWDNSMVCDASDCPEGEGEEEDVTDWSEIELDDDKDWIEPIGILPGFSHECGSKAASCEKLGYSHINYQTCQCVQAGGAGETPGGPQYGIQ